MNRTQFLALLLSELLALPVSSPMRAQKPAPAGLSPQVYQPLREALQKSYLDLFEIAPKLEFSQTQIEAMRKYLDKSKDTCAGNFKKRAEEHGRQLRDVQASLKASTGKISDEQRRQMHCRIQNLRAMESQARVLAEHAIPVAYENRKARLDLIEKWPDELKRIQDEIKAGTYHQRKFGDVKDIGFRELERGQEQDVKDGQEAIRQMKLAGLMPPEIDNPAVKKYVTDLALKIAKHSDLRVPLNVTLLNSKEVNAFALPGGFLFIQRGVLEAAEDESQLAGVIAHTRSRTSRRATATS